MSGPAINRHLPVYEELRLNRFQSVSMFTFLGASLLYNYLSKKPRTSGMLRHAAVLYGGHFVGGEIAKFVEKRRKTRVLILEDYISRHPEDFPVTESKSYGDILMKWSPTR